MRVEILRGIPGCGKSTLCEKWLTAGPRRARVSRDEIRLALFGKDFGVDETVVTNAQNDLLRGLLDERYDVMIDNTNIRWTYVREFAEIIRPYGATITVVVIDVPLEVAIERNNLRAQQGGRFVPVDVIEKMHMVLESNKHLTL